MNPAEVYNEKKHKWGCAKATHDLAVSGQKAPLSNEVTT
jgi:hypothetical protein